MVLQVFHRVARDLIRVIDESVAQKTETDYQTLLGSATLSAFTETAVR